jgi:hypothetical protein
MISKNKHVQFALDIVAIVFGIIFVASYFGYLDFGFNTGIDVLLGIACLAIGGFGAYKYMSSSSEEKVETKEADEEE